MSMLLIASNAVSDSSLPFTSLLENLETRTSAARTSSASSNTGNGTTSTTILVVPVVQHILQVYYR